MKRHQLCPKCQSRNIIADVEPLDTGQGSEGTTRLAVYRNPAALLFKGRQSSKMSAWVCAECGFVEFYADDPGALKVRDS